jgi:hypothetical protein
MPLNDRYSGVAAEPERKPAPKWFLFVRAWAMAPVVAIALAAGYATGHVVLGALIALGYLISDRVFFRWARARYARVHERLADPEERRRYNEQSDRLARIFGLYFAVVGALLVLAVLGLVIAKLV